MPSRQSTASLALTCVMCDTGRTAPGTAASTFDEGPTTVVIYDIPADVCSTCGAAYFDAATTSRVLEQALAAKQAGAKLALHKYGAA